MLHSTEAIKILNGLFGKTGGNISFSNGIYVGLLTKMPEYIGGKWINFEEPSLDTGYKRINIDGDSRITEERFIGPAVTDEGNPIQIDGCQAFPSYVENDAAIMFEEAMPGYEGEGENKEPKNWVIVGFGLFRSQKIEGVNSTPFLWGPITGEAEEGDEAPDKVVIANEEVPIIQAHGFKISLV